MVDAEEEEEDEEDVAAVASLSVVEVVVIARSCRGAVRQQRVEAAADATAAAAFELTLRNDCMLIYDDRKAGFRLVNQCPARLMMKQNENENESRAMQWLLAVGTERHTRLQL